MPFTKLQAQDQRIFNSVIQFLDRDVKQPYDLFVATLTGAAAFNTELIVRPGSPDDPEVVLSPPVVAVDTMESTERASFYAIGTAVKWRHMNFALYCYPAILANGQPSKAAQLYLQSAIRDSLGVETVKILDSSNPLFSTSNVLFTTDVAYLDGVVGPIPRGSAVSMAEERHRFDFHFHLRYAVSESTHS